MTGGRRWRQNHHPSSGGCVAFVDGSDWCRLVARLANVLEKTFPFSLGLAFDRHVTADSDHASRLLIDRIGKIADAHVGMVDKAGWEQEIQLLLTGKSRPTRSRP